MVATIGYVQPWISAATDTTQFFTPSLQTLTQNDWQFQINGYRSSTVLNITWSSISAQIATIVAMGWTPVIAFAYSNYVNILQAVNAGTFDAATIALATGFLGTPVVVCYFHEMNNPGSGNTWGNDPVNYIPAYQRLHGLWRSVGNFSPFVWAPNVTWQDSATPIPEYYPGDAYVDYMGLDGYRNQFIPSATFQDEFEADIATLGTVSQKPILIYETGAENTQTVSSRPWWIETMGEYLCTQPQIVGINWWQRDQFTLKGDSLSTGAWAYAMRSWRNYRQQFIPGAQSNGLLTMGGSLLTNNNAPAGIWTP